MHTPLKFEIELTPEQVEMIVSAVADRLRGKKDSYSVKEVAEMVGRSAKTIHRRIEAGVIQKIPGVGGARIAAAEVDRLLGKNTSRS